MVERIRILLESRQLTPTQFADAIGVARPIVSHILSGRNRPSLEVVQRILAAMPDLAMPWLLNGTGDMLVATPAAPPTVGAPASARPEVSSLPVATPPMSPVAAPAAVWPESVAPQGAVSTPPPVAPTPVTGSISSQTADSLLETQLARPDASPAASTIAPPHQAPVNVGASGRGNAPVAPRTTPVPKRFTAAALKATPLPPVEPIAEKQPLPTATVEAPVATPPPPVEPAAAPAQEPAISPPPAPTPAVDAGSSSLASALFAGAEKPIRRIVIFYRDGSFADYQPE
jgi:DNA-binding XRE family transcriptional regulator